MIDKTLLDRAKRYHEQTEAPNASVLIYGFARTGKTRFASTVAKLPSIENVYWFDLENGLDTVISNNILQEHELAKIIPISIKDTTVGVINLDEALSFKQLETANDVDLSDIKLSGTPRAAETFLKIFTATDGVYIDLEEGRVVPRPTDQTIHFDYNKLTSKDVVVIDTGTQLARSMFSLCILINPSFRHAKKWWAEFYSRMNIIMTRIQSANHTKFICIAHEQIEEPPEEITARRKTRGGVPTAVGMHYPVWGSKNYSLNIGTFFGVILNLTSKGETYGINSTPTSANMVLAGSRYDINIDDLKNPEIKDLLVINPKGKR